MSGGLLLNSRRPGIAVSPRMNRKVWRSRDLNQEPGLLRVERLPATLSFQRTDPQLAKEPSSSAEVAVA